MKKKIVLSGVIFSTSLFFGLYESVKADGENVDTLPSDTVKYETVNYDGTGWVEKDGYTYYMDSNSGLYIIGKQTIEDTIYYFNSLGERLEGRQSIYGEDFYLGEDGKAETKLILTETGLIYTEDGRITKNEFKTIDGNTYYFGEDGIAYNKGLTTIGSDTYFFAENGVMTVQPKSEIKTGWVLKDGNTYYVDPKTGKYLIGKQVIDGSTYYFNSLGVRLEGRQIIYGEDYHLGNDGKAATRVIPTSTGMLYTINGQVVKNSFIVLNGYTYYFGENGDVYNDGVTKIGAYTYYFGANGVMGTGALYTNNHTYYFDSRGRALTGRQVINGNTYYFNSLGQRLEGRQIVYGADFHLGNDGIAATRVIPIREGMLYTINGEVLKNAWQNLNGNNYYFGADGLVYNDGLSTIKSYIYYFKNNGVMSTGWLTTGGHTYYMNESNGIARIGKQVISGDTYYFNSLGQRLEGRTIVYGLDFHLGKDGKAATRVIPVTQGMVYTINGEVLKNAWQNINGYNYYFGADGYVYNKGITKIGNQYYYFAMNGITSKGWILTAGNTYYLDPTTGAARVGKQVINGDTYYFNSLGVRLQGKTVVYGEDFHLGSDGKAATRIVKDDSGTYYTENGVVIKSAFRDYNGNTYYLGADGIAYVGGHQIGGKDYFFDANGILSGRWINKDGHTFYLKKDGNYANDWTTINGNKYFFNSLGHMIGSGPAKKVIDVSDWQGIIDWDRVIYEGEVDKVILRCGFGSMDKNEDKQFARNVSELRRLNVPFSIYLYSYADVGSDGIIEADFVKRLINKYSLPSNIEIYYDIENNGYGTTLSDYEQIIPNFINTLRQAGYNNAYVYSYTSYLNTHLNSSLILPYVKWVAEYNHYCNYTGSSYVGWQYSSTERLPGIVGNVDMNVWFE